MLFKLCAISILLKCCVTNTEKGVFLKVHEYLLDKDFGGTGIIISFYQKVPKQHQKGKRKVQM